MKSYALLVLGFGLSCASSADVIWDTLSGSAGRAMYASSENLLSPTDWISAATPVTFASSYSLASITIVGQHLRFDGIGVYTVSDPTPSLFTVNAWSSAQAFLASPLQGDLWSVGSTPTTQLTGTTSGGGTPLSTFRFSLGGAVIPAGTSIIGVNSLSLPTTFGSLYWSRTDPSTPGGYRVQATEPSYLEPLAYPLALKVESATPVPEPGTVLPLAFLGSALALRRKIRLRQ